MRVEESVIVDKPNEEVFDFFDQRSNDPRWMGTVLESEWTDPDESTHLGRRGRMVMDAMGTREFTDVVVEYEPGRVVATPLRLRPHSDLLGVSDGAHPRGDTGHHDHRARAPSRRPTWRADSPLRGSESQEEHQRRPEATEGSARGFIEAAGLEPPPIERPAGLTEREAQVLSRLAHGLQTKQVARDLDISIKTADHHIQSAYRKIGVSTRAVATLFAMEHGMAQPGDQPATGS